MKNADKFLPAFIGEQVDILAKMAQLEGFETLAFILQMAKAETNKAQMAPVESQTDDQRCAH